ncbi:MAG: proline--tRNA ligase [Deferribacteraceae bacterium]|jgi:prolyl-tRNA synthetase|nr:proline--tRNA ligase [Deferribacteraceae bacterium]
MRVTQFFMPTLREAPADAEVISHILMIRAGMIKKSAAGIYTYLPMGLRVIRKVENIIRQCMNETGAIELLMPSVQPAELWRESGRWQHYGKELLRMKDRHNRDFCFGPTHEEVITEIIRTYVSSYKQLPVNLYQIQTKFRDEVRPRFGLMRGREFIMKDAYSFDIDEKGAQESYEKMRRAYCRIFESCELSYKMVDADSGAIGGSFSHEFMVVAQTGEDAIISCGSCNYTANMEKAASLKPDNPHTGTEEEPKERHTPNMHTVSEVAKFLNVPETTVIKTIIVQADDTVVAILVRGDHEANLIKLKNYLGVAGVEMATPDNICKVTGAPVGFAGPVGLSIPIYADNAVSDIVSAVTGGNKKDTHITGVKPGRDFAATVYGDFRNAVIGDICPSCGGKYTVARGIEVGHIFKLGTKYSVSMQAKYLDAGGKQQQIIMGCYGIGVGRVSAAAIEQSHDEAGIIWPVPIAPFEVAVVPLNTNEPVVVNLAEIIYTELKNAGADVIIDDRNERAGVKLADADLIGYPLRVTIGKRTLSEGLIEVTIRKTRETTAVKRENIIAYVKNTLISLGKS